MHGGVSGGDKSSNMSSPYTTSVCHVICHDMKLITRPQNHNQLSPQAVKVHKIENAVNKV